MTAVGPDIPGATKPRRFTTTTTRLRARLPHSCGSPPPSGTAECDCYSCSTPAWGDLLGRRDEAGNWDGFGPPLVVRRSDHSSEFRDVRTCARWRGWDCRRRVSHRPAIQRDRPRLPNSARSDARGPSSATRLSPNPIRSSAGQSGQRLPRSEPAGLSRVHSARQPTASHAKSAFGAAGGTLRTRCVCNPPDSLGRFRPLDWKFSGMDLSTWPGPEVTV